MLNSVTKTSLKEMTFRLSETDIDAAFYKTGRVRNMDTVIGIGRLEQIASIQNCLNLARKRSPGGQRLCNGDAECRVQIFRIGLVGVDRYCGQRRDPMIDGG